MNDDTDCVPHSAKVNGSGIDLDFARRAAAKSKAKRDEEQKRFDESQRYRRAVDRYNIAWDAWSGTWENIVLSRNGSLIGEAGEEDLAAALDGLVEVIRDRGYIDQLPLAAERFDPSYCDGTGNEEEANAVKIVLQALNTVASGTDAGEVAAALLSLDDDELPRLCRAGSIRRLLRVADQWPVCCENCGVTQPPHSFEDNRCPDCASTVGTLVSLFKHIRRADTDPSKQVSSTDSLFLFWSGWREKLQAVFPGTDGDLALMHKWIEYLETTKEMERHAWQLIKFAEADALLPPVMSVAREQYSTANTPTQGFDSAAAGVSFAPENCDDDLWNQLDVCIRAMEKANGGAYGLIYQRNFGDHPHAKYLQNINQLAEQAGWEPFVFPRDDGLEVVRISGGKAFCRRLRGSFSRDEVGGEAVLSALRAWREKRTAELQSKHNCQALAGPSVKPANRDGSENLTALAKSIETLGRTLAKPKAKRRDNEAAEEQRAWEKVYREYDDSVRPRGYKRKKPGSWTVKFEAFYNDRDDLQRWTLEAAWRLINNAKKRIQRRSR